MLVMATGCGKTITFASLPKMYPELAKHGILILVHRDELVFQAVEKYKMVHPTALVGVEKAEYKADLACDVIVASVQTLGHKSMGRLIPLLNAIQFGIVIVDEAHHISPGSQYDRILMELGLGSQENVGITSKLPDGSERLLFGVTATPNRHDKVGLSHFFQDVVMDFGVLPAVGEGYLTDIEHYIVKTGEDISGVGSMAGDFGIAALSDATNTEKRNNVIVSAYRKHSLGKSAIGFCSSVEHAHALAATFNDAGITAAAIDGTTNKDLRRDILRGHEAGEIDVVTNFGVLTEGYDGVVHTILQARPTKSQPLYIQMLGRGLRTIPPNLGNLPTKEERLEAIANSVKPSCIVLDFVDNGHEVVTTPSLFGLNHQFNSDGKKVIGVTVQRFNDAVEANPMNAEGIKNSVTFEEVEVETKKVNVWTLSQSHKGFSDVSDLHWTRIAPDMVQMTVTQDGMDGFTVRLTENQIGHWDLTAIRPKSFKNGYTVPETHSKLATYPDMETGIKACDARVKTSYPDAVKLLDTKARWRSTSPSQNQINMLRAYGIDVAGVASKGQASDLISAAKDMGKSQSRAVWNEIRREQKSGVTA